MAGRGRAPRGERSAAQDLQAGLLEKAGLLTRAPSTGDERSTTVTITQAGRERLQQIFSGQIDLMAGLPFAPLSTQAVTALAALLQPIRDHMRAAPPRSAAPRRKKAARNGAPAPAT